MAKGLQELHDFAQKVYTFRNQVEELWKEIKPLDSDKWFEDYTDLVEELEDVFDFFSKEVDRYTEDVKDHFHVRSTVVRVMKAWSELAKRWNDDFSAIYERFWNDEIGKMGLEQDLKQKVVDPFLEYAQDFYNEYSQFHQLPLL